jgi:hypothetical protein
MGISLVQVCRSGEDNDIVLRFERQVIPIPDFRRTHLPAACTERKGRETIRLLFCKTQAKGITSRMNLKKSARVS